MPRSSTRRLRSIPLGRGCTAVIGIVGALPWFVVLGQRFDSGDRQKARRETLHSIVADSRTARLHPVTHLHSMKVKTIRFSLCELLIPWEECQSICWDFVLDPNHFFYYQQEVQFQQSQKSHLLGCVLPEEFCHELMRSTLVENPACRCRSTNTSMELNVIYLR
jgi:hypothetical protein